ncbi:MAG: type I 3-dehydroquinate dehydratase [Bacteroidales bacterium]
MICVSLQNKNSSQLQDLLLDKCPFTFAEIRLDRCNLNENEVEDVIAGSNIPLIATCRMTGTDRPEGSLKKSESLLLAAITSGATYVDLELEAPASISKRISRVAHTSDVEMIRSYHDFQGTPDFETLKEIALKCKSYGADIIKIVTTANTPRDVETVSKLYDCFPKGTLVAFCMGEHGRQSRIDCLRLGAPFTYACLNEKEAAAPGQMPYQEMFDKIFGGHIFRIRSKRIFPLPASKSFAQRSIIAASLAKGKSNLSGLLIGSDIESAMSVAIQLGAEIKDEPRSLEIKGVAARCASKTISELSTGESGLLTRIMIPVLSAINKVPVTIFGVKTLLNRPLSGAKNIMASFGVLLKDEAEHPGAKPEDCYVPLSVNGTLTPGKADVSGKNGSQLISGLLMALPLCKEDSKLFVRNPKSIPYIFITLDVMKKFGVNVDCEMEGGDEFLETRDWGLCTKLTFRIKGGQSYSAANLRMESDWSAAANILVAGSVFGSAGVNNMDMGSLQADLSILDILQEAGAHVFEMSDEGALQTDIYACQAPLRAFEVNTENCPDLFPIVSILAAFCEGQSRIGGVSRLVTKESNRAAAVSEMLKQMNVDAHIEDDELVVNGIPLARRALEGRLLKGGKYSSHSDHRMVMALKVAGLGADSPIEIDDTACVTKSFPGFDILFDELLEKY